MSPSVQSRVVFKALIDNRIRKTILIVTNEHCSRSTKRTFRQAFDERCVSVDRNVYYRAGDDPMRWTGYRELCAVGFLSARAREEQRLSI